jgi:hypothetical protein
MPVINVLYLPRHERLRAIVRTILDFVEEVYRGELIAGVRFVAFDLDDEADKTSVEFIAYKERFTTAVKHERCTLNREVQFFTPHSHLERWYVWVPIRKENGALSILDFTAHELAHIALVRLPVKYRRRLVSTFFDELDLTEELKRLRVVPAWLTLMFRSMVDEIAVTYMVANYFKGLQRTPETPTTMIKPHFIVSARLVSHLLSLPSPKLPKRVERMVTLVFLRVARKDLPEFRKEVHEIFMKMIKKLPIEVLESNRAKYKILYS